MSSKRQLRLGAFMRPVSIHTAAWRYPGGTPDANFNLKALIRYAQTLERGKFDAFFMADHLAVLNMPMEALKRSATVTSFDPLTLLPALAQHTQHLGLIATASTTFEPAYTIARRFASLDHISEGRAGWNLVTTSNPDAALNFGMDEQQRQMRRYNVPRLAFINKLDRAGADPARVTHQLKEKLRHNTITTQLPIGAEADFDGIIDLIRMKAFYFDGDNGEDIREEEIPADRVAEAKTARHDMIASIADHDDQIADKFLAEQDPSIEEVRAAIRRVTIALKMTPVFIGSAYKNKGVQLLLDGVNMYLPNPMEVQNIALDQDKGEEKVILSSDPKKPFVGLAFKLEDGRYGQLTYMRVYQGSLTKGDFIVQLEQPEAVKVPRLVRMHSSEMNDVETHDAGDIVALFGVECSSGDTFTNESINYTMTSMHVPDAVISLAVSPKDKANASQLLEGAQPLHEGGPDLPRPPRRGVGPDHHQRHGRASPRDLHRAHEARVRLRGDLGQAPGRLPRGDPPARRVQLHPQEADRRLGPVRQGRGLHRAVAGRSPDRLRVRGRDRRWLDPARVHPGLREGLPRGDQEGSVDRLPDRRRQVRHQRRRLAPGRLVGNRVPHRVPHGLPRGVRQRQADDPRADHAGRGRSSPRSSRARSWGSSISAAAPSSRRRSRKASCRRWPRCR